jgi:tubulin--tyrosine ligase-like protein 12
MLILFSQENILKISSKEKNNNFNLLIDYFRRNLCENTQQFINQYPFENVINIKDLLAVICRRTSLPINNDTLQSYPLWLPTTFNLTYELPKLISYFQHRETK